MSVYEFVITIILQKIYAVLDDCGGDQAVNRIADGDAIAPEFSVDRCAQFKG